MTECFFESFISGKQANLMEILNLAFCDIGSSQYYQIQSLIQETTYPHLDKLMSKAVIPCGRNLAWPLILLIYYFDCTASKCP